MLVLASQSPRRAELLRGAAIPFVVRPAPGVDETPRPHEKPEDYAQRVAEEKALAAPASPEEVVLGADTIVVIDGLMLGKPAGDEDAARMMRLLSGRRHEVITGICLRFPTTVVRDWAVTQVWFTELSGRNIEDYVASGEPHDKAGAYGIQGIASRYIEKIDGEYANVVGLPVALVWRHLRDRGFL